MDIRTRQEERSLGELFADLSRDSSMLLRQEMELARLETSRMLSQVMRDSIVISFGLALAYAGLLGLLAAAIYGLGTAVPWWASALIIGGGTLLVGLILVFLGQSKLKNRDLKPRHTFDTVKEDIQWAKRQMK